MALCNHISTICIVFLSFLAARTLAAIACSNPDCIIYDISTESSCTEVASEPRTNDCHWYAGLQSNVDQIVKGGRIIAYQIQWSGGDWSGW